MVDSVKPKSMQFDSQIARSNSASESRPNHSQMIDSGESAYGCESGALKIRTRFIEFLMVLGFPKSYENHFLRFRNDLKSIA